MKYCYVLSSVCPTRRATTDTNKLMLIGFFVFAFEDAFQLKFPLSSDLKYLFVALYILFFARKVDAKQIRSRLFRSKKYNRSIKAQFTLLLQPVS